MKTEKLTEKEAALLTRIRVAKIWAGALVLIVSIICFTLIYLNSHAWTIRFEMDDNTLEAVKSINWSSFACPQNSPLLEELNNYYPNYTKPHIVLQNYLLEDF